MRVHLFTALRTDRAIRRGEVDGTVSRRKYLENVPVVLFGVMPPPTGERVITERRKSFGGTVSHEFRTKLEVKVTASMLLSGWCGRQHARQIHHIIAAVSTGMALGVACGRQLVFYVTPIYDHVRLQIVKLAQAAHQCFETLCAMHVLAACRTVRIQSACRHVRHKNLSVPSSEP